MIGALILFLVPAVAAFAAALLVGRRYRPIGWIAGGVPALLLAWANLAGLGDPLVWLYLLLFWLPSALGGHAGAELGRRLLDRRQRRRAGRAAAAE